MVKIETTVKSIELDGDDCYILNLNTRTLGVFFEVETCDDKYKEEETYALKVYRGLR